MSPPHPPSAGMQRGGLLGPERSALEEGGGGSSTLRAPLPGPWGSQRPRLAALHLPEQNSQKASAMGLGSQALAEFLPGVIPHVPLPCSVLPMGPVLADFRFQLLCATQELQCRGKRLQETLPPCQSRDLLSPPAPCSSHPSPLCLPTRLHSVLLSASSHCDDSLEWLPQALHPPSKGCAIALLWPSGCW